MWNSLGNIKRIVLLVENHFTLRDYRRFGIETLQENGFLVEVWNVMHITYPGSSKAGHAYSDLSDFKGVVIFNNKKDADRKFLNLSQDDFVISLVNFRWISLGLYRTISRSGVKYAVSYAEPFPWPPVKKTLTDRIRDIASFRRATTWKHFIARLPLWFLGVKPANLMFVTGEKYLNYDYCMRYPVDKNTEILHIHTFDYDLYLKERNGPGNEKSTAVFLDEFYPFHPDYALLNRESPVKADSYYKSLNVFFDLVEKETGFSVIIAAHPKSDYQNQPDYFSGRKCIKGRTARLIKESRLVLAHSSTSVKLANLFYKPVIFMTFLGLDRSYEGECIKEFARSFNKNPISIDKVDNIDWQRELTVARDYYDNYRKIYIKSDKGKDLPFWQIVADRLKNNTCQ